MHLLHRGAVYFRILCIAGLLCSPVSTQVFGQDAHLQYLTHLYETGDNDIQELLLDEFENFLQWYPDGEYAGRAIHMVGNIYNNQGNESLAVTNWIKSALVYSSTVTGQRALEDARTLIIKNRHFNDSRQAYLELLSADAPAGNLETRWYQFLLAIEKVNDSDAYQWFIADSREFIQRYPQFLQNDHVLLNIAQAYDRNKQDKQAVYSYYKMEVLYPQSQFVPYARLRRGKLYYEELNNRDIALLTLDGLIGDYPGDQYAPEAQYLTGELKEKKYDDPLGAIERYMQMHRAYPNSPLTVDALFRAANLAEDKLKDYTQSIEIYQLIADVYTTQPEADKALAMAADVYEDRLKDYNNAIGLRLRMMQLFPDSPRTVDNIMAAGDLAENRLKDYRRAIEIYQIVTKNYGLSNKAKDAVKRIESLEKKLSEQ